MANVVVEATGAAINSSTAKFGVLGGAYFSTPDTAGNSSFTDFDIQALVAMDNWTPAAQYTIAAKDLGGGLRGWEFCVDATTGLLRFRASVVSGYDITKASSVAPTVNNGALLWVRATRNGTSGDVNFYTAPFAGSATPPTSWTQLGTTQTSAVTGATLDNSAAVTIGGNAGGASNQMVGRVWRVVASNTIGSTSYVWDFNPNLSTSAPTFTASTGEVWTSNGTARIFGNTSTTYGIPAPWDASGPVGYNAEPAATNLCLQSQTFDSATWTKFNTGTIVADQAVAPDGTTTADLLYPGTTGGIRTVYQTFATAGGAQTYGVCAKAAGKNFVYIYDDAGVTACWFNLSTGAVGTNNTALTPSIVALPNSWYRCSLTKTAAIANPLTFYIGVADADNNLTGTTSGTNGIYIWGAQSEASSVATSPITTTTVAVTRNADVLTYASSGNISGTIGSVYCEYRIPTTGNNRLVSPGAYLMWAAGATSQNMYDNTTIVSTANAPSTTSVNKGAIAWSSTQINCLAGGTVASGAFDGNMNFGASISVGSDFGGTDQLNGNIRNVRIYGTALSAAQLKAMTS